ncbi:MAG: type II toxin-antitoxin system VapC family toxin [Candidatus Bathyarchaeia archaeon]|jgi:predicted nucleic acid-binding protein
MNLLDTSVVIEIIAGIDTSGIISQVTLFEILRGIDDKKRTAAKRLLEESFIVLNLDNTIIEAYCKIYRKLKAEGNLLPDADLIIAATAIAHNLVLETKDNHFRKLEPLGLKIK